MKKAALLFIGSVISSLASAQTTTAIPLTENPQSRFTMGFNVGSTYNIYNWEQPIYSGIFRDDVRSLLGLKVGIITEYKFSSHFSFSPKIELAFTATEYDNSSSGFSISGIPITSFKTNNTSIDFTGHIKLKAKKTYIVIGPSLKVPISGGDFAIESNVTIISLDIGIGIEKKFKHFIIAPELRLTAGTSNTIGVLSDILTYKNISLMINFSGL